MPTEGLIFTDLEERQETIELAFVRSAIEAHSARIEEGANQPNAEEIVRCVNGADNTRQRPALVCIIFMVSIQQSQLQEEAGTTHGDQT